MHYDLFDHDTSMSRHIFGISDLEFYRGGLAAAPPLPGIDTVAAAYVRGCAGRLARQIDVTSRRLSRRWGVERER